MSARNIIACLCCIACGHYVTLAKDQFIDIPSNGHSLAFPNIDKLNYIGSNNLDVPEWLTNPMTQSKVSRRRRFLSIKSNLTVKATVWLPANFLFGIPSTSVIFQTTFRFYVPPNIPIPLNNFGFVLLGRDGSGHKRIDLFKQMENFYQGFGLNGVQCSLRTICEVAELPFDHGLIGEIINFLFALTASPNEINSTSPITPDNYREAKELGEQRGDCWSAYPECDMSFLDWISAI